MLTFFYSFSKYRYTLPETKCTLIQSMMFFVVHFIYLPSKYLTKMKRALPAPTSRGLRETLKGMNRSHRIQRCL